MEHAKKNPLVTVIIPTYNRSEKIVYAIESVFNQTYHNYEIIIIDDGSTDTTKNVIAQYADKVVYFYQVNKGPSAARNLGIRNAKGKYIAFLDSDDMWLPVKLAKQVKILQENPDVGIVSSGYFRCFAREDCIEAERLMEGQGIISYSNMLIRNLCPTPTVIIKKECFDRKGAFNEKYSFGEDWDMWVRVASDYPILYIDEPLCKVLLHDDSISSKNQKYNFNDWAKLIEKNKSRAKTIKEKTICISRAWSWYYLSRANYYRNKNKKLYEISYLVLSITHWPFDKIRRYKFILRALLPARVSKFIRNNT